MKTRKTLLLASMSAVVLGLCSQTALATTITDTFDGPTIDPAWSVDRYQPSSSSIQTVGGQSAMVLEANSSTDAAHRPPGFSDTFYNYQGLQRDVTMSGNWSLSEQIYLSDNTMNGLANIGMWGRTGLAGNESTAAYDILAFRNPGGTAGGGGFYSWDDVGGNWISVGSSATEGWHTFLIKFDGTSDLYYIDGILVRTDSSLGNPAYAADLTTAYNEIYNFGGDRSYSGAFDNLVASTDVRSVPDGGNTAFMSIFGIGGLVGMSRLSKRKKSVTVAA